MARRFKRSYKRKRTYSKSRFKRRPVSKKLKRYVSRAISRNVENKRASHTVAEKNINNIMDTASLSTLLPALAQGTGQGNRIGNAVKLKKAILRSSFTSYAGSANAFYVDIYIFKLKGSVASPTLVQLQQFLQNGNSSTWYDGDPIDGLRAINTDVFTCHKHKRITLASTTAGSAGTSINVIPPTRTWVKDITSYYPKNWRYEDNSASLPTNVALFMACAATDMTGLVIANYGEWNACVEFEFEDA